MDFVHKLFNRELLFYRNWISFFALGTINNLAYVVVGAAAQSISHSFGKDNLIGLITWANVGFGVFVRGANTFFLESIPYWIRVYVTAILFLMGLLGLAFSTHVDFWFALICIIFVGAASSFGESVLLGYMRLFQPEVVDGWSSGTGMAGVLGSLLYLGFQAAKFSNQTSFLLLTPFAIIYCLIYGFVLKRPDAWNESRKESEDVKHFLSEDSKDLEKDETIIQQKNSIQYTEEDEDLQNLQIKPLTESALKRNLRCIKQVWWLALQLCLVYMFEYIISAGASDKAEKKDHDSSWVVREAYPILSFCYQIGVLISRSSLSFFKIKYVEVLTVLQGANLVIWLLHDEYKFMNIYVQFAAMVFVGLLGGAMYVNVFYLLLNDPLIDESDRELCVNLVALSITLGITAAAFFIVLMDNTFLSDA